MLFELSLRNVRSVVYVSEVQLGDRYHDLNRKLLEIEEIRWKIRKKIGKLPRKLEKIELNFFLSVITILKLLA